MTTRYGGICIGSTYGGLHDTMEFGEDGTLIDWHQTSRVKGGGELHLFRSIETIERVNDDLIGLNRGSFNPSPEALTAFGDFFGPEHG